MLQNCQNYLFQFSLECSWNNIVNPFHQRCGQTSHKFLGCHIYILLPKKSDWISIMLWDLQLRYNVTMTTLWFLNSKRIPIRLLNRSSPVNSVLFRLIPSNLLAGSNNTHILFDLFTLSTGWWGRYHVLLLTLLASTFDGFLAYLFLI